MWKYYSLKLLNYVIILQVVFHTHLILTNQVFISQYAFPLKMLIIYDCRISFVLFLTKNWYLLFAYIFSNFWLLHVNFFLEVDNKINIIYVSRILWTHKLVRLIKFMLQYNIGLSTALLMASNSCRQLHMKIVFRMRLLIAIMSL